MSTMLLSPADEARRVGLRRMRVVALGLLVAAAVVYALTHGRDGAWGFVNAACEAAMVGAIADWFAVTALFRHPLGLPIPHTAIIPRRKDSLGQGLEEFVTDNFLTEDNARSRFVSADVTSRVGRWLAEPDNAARVVTEAAPTLARGLQRMRDEDMQQFIEDSLLPRVRKEPLAPIAGHLLDAVVHDGAHHGLVDIGVREIHGWLVSHRDSFAGIVAEKAPWWSPQWLDEKVIDRVYREAVTFVAEVRDQPAHRVRLALDSLLADLGRDLQQDPDTMARAEALKERILTHSQVGPTIVAVWDAIRTALLEALDDPDAHLRTRMAESLSHLGGRLDIREGDVALHDRVESVAADAVAYMVRTYGREVASVISQTIDRWDGKEAAERIELHVGRDLQFIRINGTVVGGLVGLVIHTVSVLL